MLKLNTVKIEPQLIPFVQRITLFSSIGAIDYKQKIMPSGYSYMSYNLKDIPQLFIGEKVVKSCERLQLIGPKTKSRLCVHHVGEVEQVLIEFTATGFYRLFKQSPANYCNSQVSYCNFQDEKRAKVLIKVLDDKRDINPIVKQIQNHLLQLANKAQSVDDRIAETINRMEMLEGIMSVQDAYEFANIGERHFNRLFRQIVGCSPKLFLKILQLHHIISKMSGNNKTRMLDLAYLSGFYDQAHFNKSFKKMVNLSPSKFINSSEHVSLQYFRIC